MQVFFTASKSSENQYQHIYDEIVKQIQSEENDVISLEIMRYEDLLGKEYVSKNPKNQVHYDFLKKGMNRANAVIIESSVNSFRLGHEATMALLYDKPVLCLSDNRDYSGSILHPKFYSEIYQDKSDIEKLVKSFLSEVKNKHLSLRKNIYMTPDHSNFLHWFGRQENMNASEVVRKMIEDKMREHPNYDMYFSLSKTNE